MLPSRSTPPARPTGRPRYCGVWGKAAAVGRARGAPTRVRAISPASVATNDLVDVDR